MIPRHSLLLIVFLHLVAIVVSVLWYERLPELVPTHWNAAGDPDDFGSRWKVTVLMPALMLVLTLLLHYLPQLGPFRTNIESFRPTFGRIAVVGISSMLAIHIITILAAAGWDFPITRAIPIGVGLLMATLGNWLGKLRRNFYVGVRTPWTIANDEVWERTHRLGGRLLVVYGTLLIIVNVMIPGWGFAVGMAGILVIALWLTVYSAMVYRQIGRVDQLE